jgi:1-deoxy-D-xylulose-5-phosphate synthase
VPGLRYATPRDETTLRELLREAVAVKDGPTVVRYPKTPVGADLPALRRIGTVDVLAEPDATSPVDVLAVAVGAIAEDVVAAAAAVGRAGYTVRVVAPRWVSPLDSALSDLAGQASLVVTVEDGVVSGGVGSRLAQTLRETGRDVPTREIGIPVRFLEHGNVAGVRASVGLTVQDIGRRIVEWAATVAPGSVAGTADDDDLPTARRAGEFGGD